MKYNFELHQKLKFEVIDDDGNGSFELIGSAETSMGNIMGAKAQTFTEKLANKDKKNLGTIIVRAEAVKESNMWCHFRIQGMQLPNV
jgi:hypothetical protein